MTTPELSAGDCTKGCYAFRTTAALRKLTGTNWSVAPDGSAYVSSMSALAADGWQRQAQRTFDTMDGLNNLPAESLAWTTQNKDGSHQLHLKRHAVETGNFVEKLKQSFTIDPVAGTFYGTGNAVAGR